jgi:DNA modification methylase
MQFSRLMKQDLNFTGRNTLYATHGLHSYAAKCPPQLVQYGIEKYSCPGDTVLDPMAGSGTTIVEAKIHQRNSIGFDIDPLACLIARVKARFIQDDQIEKAARQVILNTRSDLEKIQSGESHSQLLERAKSPNFLNRDYWFDQGVQLQLALLGYYIDHLGFDEQVREFLWVGYSGVILSKVSVANARDIIHSRHHHWKHPDEPDVSGKFEKRIQKMRKQMKEFGLLCSNSKACSDVRMGDARALPLDSNSIDIVFTSPPYATALDYPRAHFLAVSWMRSVLGIDFYQYKQKGETYIGSERGKIKEAKYSTELPHMAIAIVNQLRKIDGRKSLLIERYFHDMTGAIKEINRVLKPEKTAIIVVCPSHIRKTEVPTHKVFTEIATSFGMKLVSEETRVIDSKKRVLPYVREGFGNRMSTEYVLVYKKTSK